MAAIGALMKAEYGPTTKLCKGHKLRIAAIGAGYSEWELTPFALFIHFAENDCFQPKLSNFAQVEIELLALPKRLGNISSNPKGRGSCVEDI